MRTLLIHGAALVIAAAATLISPAVEAAVVSVGAPTTTVPGHLADGSYLSPPGVTVTVGPDQFLLPVELAGAAGVQTWQFDLHFDPLVVQMVDPFDGSSGIYGARFSVADPASLAFILGGFPFNPLGLVDDVAGSYPSLPAGPSGDGVLAYLLFEFLPGQAGNDPSFGVDGEVVVEAVPEPGTTALVAAGLLLLAAGRPAARRRQRPTGQVRAA